jgi:hypothetical protein
VELRAGVARNPEFAFTLLFGDPLAVLLDAHRTSADEVFNEKVRRSWRKARVSQLRACFKPDTQPLSAFGISLFAPLREKAFHAGDAKIKLKAQRVESICSLSFATDSKIKTART